MFEGWVFLPQKKKKACPSARRAAGKHQTWEKIPHKASCAVFYRMTEGVRASSTTALHYSEV